MCAPRSERATAAWLKQKSALGELLKHDFAPMPLMALYHASDRLFKKKSFIEEQITGQVTALTWEYQPQPASKQTHPGIYKLRTTQTDWDDETL